jgi:uncharacterized protein (TIGR00369 family)
MSSAALPAQRDPLQYFATLRTRIPYAAFLGTELLVEGAHHRFKLPFREDLIGDSTLPALHGGVIAGFMESSAQLHLLLALADRRLPKNIDFSIDYLRSGNAADTFADCEVMRQGRRVAQVQIRCWQYERADDAVAAGRTRAIAVGRAHFLLASEGEADRMPALTNPLGS